VVLSNFSVATQPNVPLPTGDVTDDNQGTNDLGSNPIVDSLTITVNTTGTYDTFRTFLAGLEQSLRPLDVTSITVNDSDTGVYSYGMTLRFYWLH
jgi:hypothetical protein